MEMRKQWLQFLLITLACIPLLIYLLSSKETNKWTEPTQPSCHPKRHIMFVKTHKTGGSTVQNLLFRYAENHNLTVALPIKGSIFFNFTRPFSLSDVEKYNENGSSYDMLAHHLKFNAELVKKVLPYNDTFYFTILRHPVPQMESGFSFFKAYAPAYKPAKSLDVFLKNAKKYYKPSMEKNCVVKNSYMYDLGYNQCDTCTEEENEKKIQNIINTLHLVLIADYFDESMVVLKEAMCWDFSDVVTFKMNSRSERVVKKVAPATAKKILQWNSLDWKLYRYYNHTFWEYIKKNIGLDKLQEGVAELRLRRKMLQKTCSQGEMVEESNKGALFYKRGVPLMVHRVKSNISKEQQEKCNRFFIHPAIYTEILHKRQYPTQVSLNSSW